MTALTIPTIPVMPAGYIAQVADLNNLAAAATFLLGKPHTHITDNTGGQACTSGTPINYTTADIDVDGMWNGASPGRLTIQTPGFYKLRYMVPTTNSGIVMNCVAQSTTGANNPLGSGLTQQHWSSYGITVSTGPLAAAGASGLWPQFLFAGDYMQILAQNTFTTSSTGNDGGAELSLEYVSI